MNERFPTDSAVFSVTNDDAVSRRAYEIWESEGRPEGCDLRHWLQAKQELGQNYAGGDGSTDAARLGTSSSLDGDGTTASTVTPNSTVPNSAGGDGERPPQATRSGGANREGKRGVPTPSGNERGKSGNGTSQLGRRR